MDDPQIARVLLENSRLLRTNLQPLSRLLVVLLEQKANGIEKAYINENSRLIIPEMYLFAG